MGLFDCFPGTSTHQLNLDWILQEMKKLIDTMASTAGRIDGLENETGTLERGLTSLSQTVSSLSARVALTAVELWRNAAPTSTFFAQLVRLADAQSSCNMLMVLVKNYRTGTAADVVVPVFISREGGFGNAYFENITTGGFDWQVHKSVRLFRWDGAYLDISDGSADDLDDDDGAIPVAVYGFNLKF